MTDTKDQLAELARRALPFLRDEAANFEDDGSNEPLELAREIEEQLTAREQAEYREKIGASYARELAEQDAQRQSPGRNVDEWQLVPKQSTDEMHKAYTEEKYRERPNGASVRISELWTAMLAAAPEKDLRAIACPPACSRAYPTPRPQHRGEGAAVSCAHEGGTGRHIACFILGSNA